MNSGTKFVIDLNLTNNNQMFYLDFPIDLIENSSYFMLTGVAGRMSADNKIVNICIPELTNSGIYSSVNNKRDVIGSVVLNSTNSKPTNRTVDTTTIGFDSPNSINTNTNLHIELRDETMALYTDAEIVNVTVTLTFWSL